MADYTKPCAGADLEIICQDGTLYFSQFVLGRIPKFKEANEGTGNRSAAQPDGIIVAPAGDSGRKTTIIPATVAAVTVFLDLLSRDTGRLTSDIFNQVYDLVVRYDYQVAGPLLDDWLITQWDYIPLYQVISDRCILLPKFDEKVRTNTTVVVERMYDFAVDDYLLDHTEWTKTRHIDISVRIAAKLCVDYHSDPRLVAVCDAVFSDVYDYVISEANYRVFSSNEIIQITARVSAPWQAKAQQFLQVFALYLQAFDSNVIGRKQQCRLVAGFRYKLVDSGPKMLIGTLKCGIGPHCKCDRHSAMYLEVPVQKL